MQAFYDRLVSGSETATRYERWLAGLTRVSLAQLGALRSNLAWFNWAESA